jgi:hypothetical protein
MNEHDVVHVKETVRATPISKTLPLKSKRDGAGRLSLNVFPSVAIVNHVHENDRFYAQAELVLAQEVSQAHIELKSVGPCVQATVLMNAKAGKNAFAIRDNGP